MKELINTNPTISSLELAEFTGKLHKNILRAIKSMEADWTEINERGFELVDYTDAKGEKRPMYNLTKMESLYLIAKFDNKVRAKLVLRWFELEQQQVVDAKNQITNLKLENELLGLQIANNKMKAILEEINYVPIYFDEEYKEFGGAKFEMYIINKLEEYSNLPYITLKQFKTDLAQFFYENKSDPRLANKTFKINNAFDFLADDTGYIYYKSIVVKKDNAAIRVRKVDRKLNHIHNH